MLTTILIYAVAIVDMCVELPTWDKCSLYDQTISYQKPWILLVRRMLDLPVPKHGCAMLEQGPRLSPLDLSSNNLTADGINHAMPFLNQIDNLIELDLSDNELSIIPSLSLPNLLTLRLSHNVVPQVPSPMLLGLPKLKELDISFNIISSIPDGYFDNMTWLSTLILSFNSLVTIPTITVPSLRNLDLRGNDIEAVPDQAISSLKGLVTLNLERNRLNSTRLPWLSALSTLNLGHNKIAQISADSWRGVPKLNDLYLSNNELTALAYDSFIGLRNLKTLYLDGNRFSTIDHRAFADLVSLNQLDLHSGFLTILPPTLFYSCTSLAGLSLAGNRLDSLHVDLFANSSNLNSLYLDGNQLSKMEQGLLRSLSNMYSLSVSNNQLSELPERLFNNMPDLQSLFLNGNQFRSLPADIFSTVPLLLILDLSDNAMSSFDALEPLANLQELYLRNNNMTMISRQFMSSKSLINFDLRSNRITAVEEHIFEQFMPSLVFLAMNGNPSICSFGLDPQLNKAVYCDCAAGYISRTSDSCTPLNDVLLTGLPPAAVLGQEYTISVSNGSKFSMSSNCGSFAELDSSLVFTVKPSATAGTLCYFQSNSVNIWSFSLYNGAQFRNPTFEPGKLSFNLTLGEVIEPHAFPSRDLVLSPNSFFELTVYVVDGLLPLGLELDSEVGILTGAPSQLVKDAQVIVMMYDTYTQTTTTIATAYFTVVSKKTSSSSGLSSLSKIEIGIGIGGGAMLLILIAFLLVLLFRERRKNFRPPQNFEEILTALAGVLQTTAGDRKVPREIKRSCITLVGDLGKGYFGQVKKGLLRELPGQPALLVAVKCSNSEEGFDHLAFLKEAAIMAQFDCAYVVRLVGVVTVGDPLLVVIEYCEHGSLHDYLQRAVNINLHEQFRIAADCAEGLDYLSARNFIHRDIAARNVLIDSEHHAKISDFGMSRETSDKEYYRSSNGQVPVRWSAPEALDEQKFSQQSDCWSYGILLYEIWTKSEQPYKEMSNQRVWTEVTAGYRLSQPTGCPDEVYTMMSKCWGAVGKRPEFRYFLNRLRTLQYDALTQDTTTSSAEDTEVQFPNVATVSFASATSRPTQFSIDPYRTNSLYNRFSRVSASHGRASDESMLIELSNYIAKSDRPSGEDLLPEMEAEMSLAESEI